MQLNDRQLKQIIGGSVGATMLNAVIKGISLIVDLGKSLGSTIRRASENKPCDI